MHKTNLPTVLLDLVGVLAEPVVQVAREQVALQGRALLVQPALQALRRARLPQRRLQLRLP